MLKAEKTGTEVLLKYIVNLNRMFKIIVACTANNAIIKSCIMCEMIKAISQIKFKARLRHASVLKSK